MSYKDTFSDIYDNFGFGSLESHSGPGSTLSETEKLRGEIVKLIREKNIKSIIDIPCGDFHWMKEISSEFESYIGGDIVEKCINSNKEKYESDKIKFITFDLLTDKIPDGDLLIVRDVIGHFPIDDGKKIVKNILESNCKYLLSTTWFNIIDEEYYKSHINSGAEYGRFYPVNLMSHPFNFPVPESFIIENVTVDDHEKGNRKVLGLWKMEELKKHMLSYYGTIINEIDKKQPINFIKSYISDLPENEKSDLLTYLSGPLKLDITNENLTVVTGLWNIGRPGRDFDHYINHFKKFLQLPVKMFIYIPSEYEYLVWESRRRENTYVKIYELDDIKQLYKPFWDKTQQIRTNPNWYNQTGENGWLCSSPQASIEWYNPIVQSKMFLLNDVTIWNPFNNEYFIWLDAGITNTVYENYFTVNRVLDKIIPYLGSFLFLSYPYEAANEIHGFNFNAINRFAGETVKYVCRGGLFGGKKEVINQANATYYSTLERTLNEGYMGTEESIFAIMSYREPNIYRRYALDGNGLISKFITNLIDDKIELEPIPKSRTQLSVTNYELSKLKTNLYILTFNFPEQVQHTINSMEKTPEWLTKPNLYLLDNSTDNDAKIKNKELCEKYNFEYIDLGKNTGICGGRLAAAEHFHNSDADFMFFFEDDMTINPPEFEGKFCRNGFRKFIPKLYDTVHKIMLKEGFDFLKLSFTEVYFDNDKQCSWYNVPQNIRTRDWPNYDKLPVNGLDPNVPLTNFKNIRNCDGVTYIDGEIYYANWPMIVSKEGNQKMFIDTKWTYPYEQTWMSHMYQLTKEEKLKPAILLASPIWHERIKHYKPEDRREN